MAMNAVDKLRLAASQYDGLGVLCGNLNAIADEIERDYCKLPVDADGVPIHVGDVLDGYGSTVTVAFMQYEHDEWLLVGMDGSVFHDTYAFTHHYNPPTVEDVLRDCALNCMTVNSYQDGIPVLGVDGSLLDAWVEENVDKLREVIANG